MEAAFEPLPSLEDAAFCRAFKHLVRPVRVKDLVLGHHRDAKGTNPPILSLQAYYTLVGRDLEREIVPMLRAEGLGLMVWSPLAGGFLSGKYSNGNAANDGRRASFNFPPVDLERGDAAIEVMRGIASTKGVSVAQVALAWLLHQPVVTSVIVGAKRIEQLQDNIRSTEVALSDEDLAALDSATQLPPEYPGWMLERQSQYRSPFAPQKG